nr:hypothetical protein [uncultured Carboxylicivirga sp.]
MKRIFTLVISFLLVCSVFAQTPELISYQAVLRNSSNELLANQSVGMQISILQGSIDGEAIYTETHSAQTNSSGLVSVAIGGGNVTYGEFKEIQWGADTYFIKTETDPAGGSNYTITGVSQLLSVPYALHAKTAERVVNGGFSVEVEVTNASSYTNYDDSDGGVSISFVGGTPPYKYFFTEAGVSSDNFGQVEGNTYNNQITFDELSSDYYEFYAEDANGAYTQRKVYIGHNSPIVYISNMKSSCTNIATGSFDMKIEGGTPGYQYSINSNAYLPYNTDGITIDNVSGYVDVEVVDAAGKRGVVFADGKNDRESSGFNIPYYKPDLSLTPVDACGDSDGGINITVDANADDVPYTYEWYTYKYDEYKGNESEVLISTDQDLTGVGPGYYNVKVTNAEGCQSEAIGTGVGYTFQPGINSNSSCHGIDISILNYTGSVSYEWSASNDFETIISTDQDLTGVESGEYYLRMTNEEGCVSTAYSFNYRSYMGSEINYNVTHSCTGEDNSSIEVFVEYFDGETVTYEWATDEDFTNVISTDKDLTNVVVPEGEYSTIYYFRMTNEEGCQSRVYSIEMYKEEFNISLNEEINRPCSGSENGSINITPDYDGTLTYEWAADSEFDNIVSTEEDLINVGQPDNGYYYLRITNEKGCSGMYSFEFYNTYLEISLNEEINRPCSGSENGSISITPDYDGTLTYQWAADSNFEIIISDQEDLSGVPSGNYYLKIISNDGCSMTSSFYLWGFSIDYESYITAASSESATDGSVQISIQTEGTFTYEWATDYEMTNVISTEEDLMNVAAGYYYLRITDTEGNMCAGSINQFQVTSN